MRPLLESHELMRPLLESHELMRPHETNLMRSFLKIKRFDQSLKFIKKIKIEKLDLIKKLKILFFYSIIKLKISF